MFLLQNGYREMGAEAATALSRLILAQIPPDGDRYTSVDDIARCLLCLAEIQVQQTVFLGDAERAAERVIHADAALDYCSRCLALEGELEGRAREMGTMAYALVVAARAHKRVGKLLAAQFSVSQAAAYPKGSGRFDKLRTFEVGRLSKGLNSLVVELFTTLTVPPGKTEDAEVEVGAGCIAGWEWINLSHAAPVSFSVLFLPQPPDEARVVASPLRRLASDGPLYGEFKSQDGGGTLRIVWHNESTGFFASKPQVRYRLTVRDGQEPTETAAIAGPVITAAEGGVVWTTDATFKANATEAPELVA
mmetsp:Transcript_20455/g.45630  ORF Transcript_20455/g.45630 Transcript_20455/m.45630 type:complete len:306 (-) Transcript_20455:440-1357(-)